VVVHIPGARFWAGTIFGEDMLLLLERIVAFIDGHIYAITIETDNVLEPIASEVCKETGMLFVPSEVFGNLNRLERETIPDDSNAIRVESNNIGLPNALGWY
jgi:hypothetical protein